MSAIAQNKATSSFFAKANFAALTLHSGCALGLLYGRIDRLGFGGTRDTLVLSLGLNFCSDATNA